ncbi:MAG TPA: hypothetical protein VEX70_09155, partial [Pyrinomonadaceae bacterium]|nr:hypothetical protein [Pyrinomonadaceae bacterium]
LESHGYAARETTEHVLYEMLDWLDRHVKNAPPRETNPLYTQYQFVSKVGLSQPPGVAGEKRAVLPCTENAEGAQRKDKSI